MSSHLALPIRVAPSGALASNAQDSAEDLNQSLRLLLATRIGERVSVPGYGTPDPLFANGFDVEAIADAAAVWEERADPVTIRTAITGAVTEVTVQHTVTAPVEPVAAPEDQIDFGLSEEI